MPSRGHLRSCNGVGSILRKWGDTDLLLELSGRPVDRRVANRPLTLSVGTLLAAKIRVGDWKS